MEETHEIITPRFLNRPNQLTKKQHFQPHLIAQVEINDAKLTIFKGG
ncbi:hypothetical protein [Limosilactobacillus caviae]|uniref:Transposase n=1 Tax=Limosilactobacillus caviae TaxID=1769424 RepID=A0ABQ2C7L1_9LACO|nr:hypothetical protein [Limosilactobacillus caviae]MCD7124505.1 hypothetical protein [Limosilactobacillus caviae]MRH47268.1 hypothetical protein [Limosilactobacillus reuteri]GGI64287.1 hypothetical protein GCM10011459_21210 [Limosilactobacillus caviae]